MKKTIVISTLFLLKILCAQAGEVDTNYIQKFSNIFALKTFLINNGSIYTFTPRGNQIFTGEELKDAKVLYTPYIPATTGVSVNIKGVGFTYIFKFTNDYADTTKHIKAGFKQFQFNMYGNKFGFEAYYQDYERFYFHYKGDEFSPRNYNIDMRAYHFGANGVFIFNGKKFSYNAAFNQTQLQKKTAGSPMMIVSLRYSELQGSNLIPNQVNMFYGNISTLERNRNLALFLQGGYAFNIVKNKFYFSNALLVGFGLQQQLYRYSAGRLYKIDLPLIGRSKSSVGYNGKVFFSGLFLNVDATQSKIQILKTQQLQYSYGFYMGVRMIKFTKSKAQLRQEAKQKKIAEREAKKKIQLEKSTKRK